MKTTIFNQALGMIINVLTDCICGGFTTNKNNNSITINFSYGHYDQSIEIQNTEKLLVFLNNRAIGDCVNIETVLTNILTQFK